MIKLGAEQLCQPIRYLINMSFNVSSFPNDLKAAEVTPVFKKNDRLNKVNYRPVSVLPCLSKVFESIYIDQLNKYFDSLLSPYLSGFRKSHNCQHVLLDFIKKCKSALDEGKMYGALLTDLSRAFDCLPHKMLITKLNAYGVDSKACMLLSNYFVGRKQRVKLPHVKGNWLNISKGAPQGSLMGPFGYNVHSNDLLCMLVHLCDVFNYADDNTLGCEGKDVPELQTKLEKASSMMLNWFDENGMQANPEKFQFIVFDRKENGQHNIHVNGIEIKSQQMVKLLGVHIDSKLTFNYHISQLCMKAGRKISVMSRLCTVLDCKTKLLLFNSFIISQFNFCPLVWQHCKRCDMIKIEKIQFRALKYVYRDYKSSYEYLRQKSDRLLMYEYRMKIMLCEVFKCVHKLNPLYMHEIFELNTHNHNTRGTMNVVLPHFNYVKYGKDTFSYYGAKMWNLLPEDFKLVNSYHVFKSSIESLTTRRCLCSYCDSCVLYAI